MLIIILAILIGAFLLSFKINGNPWERRSFKKDVESYIKSKYPDIEIKNQKVSYSFKEMKYRSLIVTDSDVYFLVWLDYNDHFVDNYYVSTWEQQAGHQISRKLQKVVNLSAPITLKISLNNEQMVPFKDLNSFTQFKDRMHDKVQLIVNYSEREISDDLLKEGFKVVEWITSQNYGMQIVFMFKGEKSIQVKEEDLHKIRVWKDLSKYIM